MRARRQLGVSVLVATGLLFAATVGLASLPPRPLRSALTVLHALTFRVAADWLAVVALLAVGGRYVNSDATADRTVIGGLAAGVFLGGVSIEASPLVRLVIAPPPVAAEPLVEGAVVAVQGALYPTGLFLATVTGAVTARDRLAGGTSVAARDGGRALPLGPSEGWVSTVAPAAVGRATAVLAAAAAVSFAVDAGVRVALGAPYPWLATVDAALDAFGAGVGYAVLAVAFLALVVEGVRPRSLAGVTALVWAALAVAGVAVAVLSAALGVTLVSATTTPMAAVEAARFGRWPAPHSWMTLLRVGIFLAGAVGLFAVQRTGRRREPPTEPGAAGRGGGSTGATTGTGSGTAGAGTGTNAGDPREL